MRKGFFYINSWWGLRNVKNDDSLFFGQEKIYKKKTFFLKNIPIERERAHFFMAKIS